MRAACLFLILAFRPIHAQLSTFNPLHTADHNPGTFGGRLKLEPLTDGINMRVLERYSYSDARMHKLIAYPGFATDGASIPRIFWTVLGLTPFSGGRYVGAAVLHDVGCVDHKYSWQITDRMFYDAMLDLNVPLQQAQMLYYAVLVGGPHWKLVTLEASSANELQHKIDLLGATPLGAPIYNAGPVSGFASLPYPFPIITRQQIQAFNSTVRERIAGKRPLTPEEIELAAAPLIPTAPPTPKGTREVDEVPPGALYQ